MYGLRTCYLENWSLTPCPLGHECLTTRKHYSQTKQICYVWASNLLPRKLESHALPSRRRMLNNLQTIFTNKENTYAINLPMPIAKMAPNTNRHNFASNSLRCNKVKASALILESIKLHCV